MNPRKLIFIVFSLSVGIIFMAGCSQIKEDIQNQHDNEDAASLRSVVAEAYINMHSDPDFVNTATEDEAMLVPEKYYTYVESVQGHGPVFVYVTIDGNVHAFFGEPYRDIHYYAEVTGERTTLPQFKDQY